jgi:hypothetical protein
MLPRLRDPDPGVRAAAIACLASHGGAEALAAARDNLSEMLSDGDPVVRAEAAKSLGSIREPLFQEQVVQLLYDSDSAVVRGAIAAVRRRSVRDGFNPLYLPSLISLLQQRRLKHDAREALVALGETAVPALVHFMNDPGEPVWVRRAIPKALSAIGTEVASNALVAALAEAQDGFLRRKLVEAVTSLPVGARAAVARELRREAGRYFAAFRHLSVLHPGLENRLAGPLIAWREEDAPDLLERLLAERMTDSVCLLFALLGILHPAEHLRAAHHTLVTGPATLRGHALELLDNTLEGEVKQDVLLVVGDASLSARLREAARLFGPGPADAAEAIFQHLDPAAEGDQTGFCIAALYAVHRGQIEPAYERARALAEQGSSHFVRETASWVLARRRGTASGASRQARRESKP